MPIFEYQCTVCSHRFSELRRGSEKDEDIGCPNCGSPKAERMVTGFAVGTGSAAKTPANCPSAADCPSFGFG